MTFNELTPELRERGLRFFKDIENKVVTGQTAAEFFFRYFFQRLKVMFADEPEKLDIITNNSFDSSCMFAVRGLFDVTVYLKSFDEIIVTEKFLPKTAKLTFDNIWTVFAVISSDLTFVQAVIEKKVKIDRLADLAKIFAPIEALSAKERLAAIKTKDMQLLSEILQELGY